MMREKQSQDTKGVSPVIGVILMVAITVILAALIGSFVLGVGDDIEENPRAGLEVIQDSDSVTITVINKGNLQKAQIVGPQGGKSMTLEDTLGVGTRIIIDERGFNNSDINVTRPPSSVQTALPGSEKDLVNGDSGSSGGEQCLIRHSADVVRGVQVNGSDIGCSGQLLEEVSPQDGFAGDEIDFRSDSEYQFIGISEGNSKSVIRRIRAGDF